MIGSGYWSAGITLKQDGTPDKPWTVSLGFQDEGFADARSSAGKLRLAYVQADPTEAVEALKADAERFGITWRDPAVYIDGDGEDYRDGDQLRRLADRISAKLGWRAAYTWSTRT